MRAVSVSMGERKAASRKIQAVGKYKNSQKLKAGSPKQKPGTWVIEHRSKHTESPTLWGLAYN
jgi:hypothetical protein